MKKKKITFRDACQIWLHMERKKSLIAMSPINNALRVSYFACFVDDKVEHLSKDAIEAIWKSFMEHWLGTEQELKFCGDWMKKSLINIANILNKYNAGELGFDWPAKEK